MRKTLFFQFYTWMIRRYGDDESFRMSVVINVVVVTRRRTKLTKDTAVCKFIPRTTHKS